MKGGWLKLSIYLHQMPGPENSPREDNLDKNSYLLFIPVPGFPSWIIFSSPFLLCTIYHNTSSHFIGDGCGDTLVWCRESCHICVCLHLWDTRQAGLVHTNHECSDAMWGTGSNKGCVHPCSLRQWMGNDTHSHCGNAVSVTAAAQQLWDVSVLQASLSCAL